LRPSRETPDAIFEMPGTKRDASQTVPVAARIRQNGADARLAMSAEPASGGGRTPEIAFSAALGHLAKCDVAWAEADFRPVGPRSPAISGRP
jgi:hypothetical protein